MKKQTFIEISTVLLVGLFIYTATSKLLDWEETRKQLYNQPIPILIAEVLLYLLPLLEISAAVLLLRPVWRKMGMVISTGLMGAFTVYVAMVMTGVFGRIPCSCGGLIETLSWGQHLVMNIFFLGISITGLRLMKAGIRENST